MKLFSVIIPVYNTEKYLRECLESVRKQSFSDFEVILVDDGSRDKSPAICDEYEKKDDRFKCIHICNGGLANARNTGMHYSKGKYICFVDSDDFIDEEYLASYYSVFYNNENIDFVYSGIRKYPSNQEILPPFEKNVIQSGITMIEKKPNVFSQGAIPFSVRYCFSRKFLLKYQLIFNKDIKYAEDSPFNMSAFMYGKRVVCIEKVNYNYRSNENSITSSYKPTMIEDLDKYHKVQMKMYKLLKNSQVEYMYDMSVKSITEWIPSCIDNFKKTKNGFSYREAKMLIKSEFVQDSIGFMIKNKLMVRKLQKIYYWMIKNKITIVHFIWKYCNLDIFV